MAQKAVQSATAALAAFSPGILVRVGSRGTKAVAKFGRVLKPKAANFGKNASVEMVPPSPSEFIQHLNNLKNDVLSGRSVSRLQNSTVNEFTAKGLVVAEVAFWFYIGEMIGRRSIIGYNPKIE